MPQFKIGTTLMIMLVIPLDIFTLKEAVKDIKLKNIPWLCKAILKTSKMSNKVFARKKRQPSNKNHRRLYNLRRNRVHNMKTTWEGITKIVNVKKMTSKPSQLNIDGKIIDDDKELATKFNNVFVNVGTNTEKTVPKVPNIPLQI